MKTINNILKIWYDELTSVMKDKGILAFILFVPLFYPLLYAYIYTNEVVRDVPIAVVNDSRSELSREFVRNMDAAPDVTVYKHCADMKEAYRALEKREVFGIVRIPRSFAQDISNGIQTHIGVYCEMSSMLYYKAILLTATNVSMEMNKNIKVKKYLPGGTDRQDEINAAPIAYDYIPYYNPQSGFACFLIPPVLMLIIQQTLLLGIGMSMGRLRENYMGCVIPFRKYYKNPFHIVCGRGLVYFMIYMVMAIYMFTFINRWFTLPHIGSYTDFFALIVPYLFACIFFAMVLSSLIYRREDCIMVFVFLSVPLLFLSGVSWPSSSMPVFWKYISWIFPSTFGMNGYIHVSSMGATLQDIGFECQALWIQAATYFILACFMYRKHIKQMLKKMGV
ncbi:ABC transporter permease [Parabacteroides merdae]|uniref:ABC transporter permease n=1 Tax=Parabacteroides merdae TaxID=46503 RepID=A0A7K1HE05_9BACT|nr:ABC transporter permease [Parabacteroides merdae]MTU29434.1 ABC transporter permease [Parabacteroides merdae]RYS83590.1 ABC transporter permease [Parabacteroides merdae]